MSPQPAIALTNSVPEAYLFQLDAIADETQFFPAMLGPWHKFTLRRQDMRAQSEWKENLVKKSVNDRRLGLIDDVVDVISDTDDFFDLGASRITTMTTGYTNKDCMTASLDDIFTTSACVKDYNDTASLEFDLHNDVEEMVYLGLRCVYVLVCVPACCLDGVRLLTISIAHHRHRPLVCPFAVKTRPSKFALATRLLRTPASK